MTPPDDRAAELELIHKCKQGETEAYEELVRKYQTRVYSVCYRMVHNTEDARDLAQEAFIAAYEAIATFKEEFRFYTWLYRIAVNRCLNFRKKAGRMSTTPLEAVDPGKLTEPVADGPDQKLERKLTREKVERAVDMLPADQKAVIVLRVYEELSYEEIAEALRIPIGTVMSRLGRARMRLKELLRDVAPQT